MIFSVFSFVIQLLQMGDMHLSCFFNTHEKFESLLKILKNKRKNQNLTMMFDHIAVNILNVPETEYYVYIMYNIFLKVRNVKKIPSSIHLDTE